MKDQPFEIHSQQIEAGVNGCIHLLEQTLKLTPPQMVFILQETAAFVAKRHGILSVAGGIHKDTGAPLTARPDPLPSSGPGVFKGKM